MTQTAQAIPQYGDPQFDHGVRAGISWHRTGDSELRHATAQIIVEFIKNNIISPDLEGGFDESRLPDLAGFLTGWIIGEFVS